MKILLLGSPDFVLSVFKTIYNNFDVVAIVCQPDKKKDRGMKISFSKIKEFAIENNILLFQPQNIKDIYEDLKNLYFDFMLTFAYGQIIPKEILNLAKITPLNIHVSLLPKYRGAAPIQWAFLNEEKISGITLMEMIPKMDAGDIYFQKSLPILNTDNAKTYTDKIINLINENIINWLNLIYLNKNNKIAQKEQEATYAPKIKKEDLLIDLNNDSLNKIKAKIKAFSPKPGAYILDENNKRIKLLNFSENEKPNCLRFKTKDGFLFVDVYQKEGKKIVFI